MENQLEGFYIMFENEERDVTYSDEGFDKVLVNFVGIETTYLKCRSSFSSKSKLHKHVKANCVEKASPPSSAQLSLFISIVMSKVIHQSLRSGFGFRGWTYTIASITLTSEHLPPNSNLDSTTCLDTDCGVTLVDQNWLLKHLPQQKISILSILLKVRGIGASMHESVAFAALSLYFPGKNNTR